jgi:predicted transcriptional regulator
MAALTQVRALAHPLRLRLLELFARGPLTAKQAAEKLGQPPTRLYHHVATLERAGLLKLARTRAVRGATEKYFEVSRESLQSMTEGAPDALRKATPQDRAAVSFALFDRARGELLRALEAGAIEKKREIMAVRAISRLTPAEARRVHRELAAVIERLKRRKKDGTAPARRKLLRYSLTMALIPTEDERLS